MLTTAYYVLKITICSGILFGYYLICLKNKIFHKWNRFYLLAAVILSSTVPLIKINISQNPDTPNTPVIKLLQVVNNSDEIVAAYPQRKKNYGIDSLTLSLFIYVLVAVLMWAVLIKTLLRVYRLKKENPQTLIDGINFINTNAKGTPFSFFNNIFWNDKIDISTSTGRQIFQHEVAHVQEKHSHDKIFVNIALIFCWCNPFFWFIRKELNMIHEFIADQKAVEGGDTAAFALMVLQATYPAEHFNITNNFFYSPLKRRLIMLNKNKHPKINYASRLLVLPLAALVFFAFTLKLKTKSFAGYSADKKVTVVIDAGHGGDDNGAESEHGIYEKNLTLSIAQKVKDLNNNKNLNIVLSRDKDENITVKQRVELARSSHADLFVSIHLNTETSKTGSGVSILIPKNDNAYLKESKTLGSDINESFKSNYQLPVAKDLNQPENGVWILKNNQYPSVIVQAGFISNGNDLKYLTNEQNQQIIARNILNGIEKYVREMSSAKNEISPTIDTIFGIKKGQSFTDTKNHLRLTADTITCTITPDRKSLFSVMQAVLVINGKIENNDILKTKTIVAKKLIIHIGSQEEMLNRYGDAAKHGVLVFEGAAIINTPPYYPDATTLKKNGDKIFTNAETETEFPGGKQAWIKYIEQVLQKNADGLIKYHC